MAARFMSKRPPTLESTIGVFLVALGALLRGSSGSCARPVVLPGRERRADTGPRGGWTVCGARGALCGLRVRAALFFLQPEAGGGENKPKPKPKAKVAEEDTAAAEVIEDYRAADFADPEGVDRFWALYDEVFPEKELMEN